MIWKCFETHLINPWFEVEAIDWWDGIVLLALFENVVVLTWWVDSKHHSLSTQNTGVVPGSLNEWLSDVVQCIKETGAFFDISVSELVADHILLSDSKRSDVVQLFWLFIGILGPAKCFLWGMRSLCADLEDMFNILSSSADVTLIGLVLIEGVSSGNS